VSKRIVLIIGGGIAAYKCLDLIRRLRERDISVRTVLTKAAQQFITPLSVSALSNDHVFTDLFDLNDEREIGHIRLSREADLIVVAPATADLLAKMASGHANDLATSVLLASDKPILIAPAMNPRMWLHPATKRNVAQLKKDGATIIGPETGEMAERDEAGPGRLAEVADLVSAIEKQLGLKGRRRGKSKSTGPLRGRHVLITSGPTHEAIDPVRYIANRSSGKQGHALADAALELGATVTLISGPINEPVPDGVTLINVQSARDMHEAVHKALPADIVICAAAVADWRVEKSSRGKIKKKGSADLTLKLVQNPDILKSLGTLKRKRPALVIGFAAETSNLIRNAKRKLKEKGADWIIANDVSDGTGTMGGDKNEVHILTAQSTDHISARPKADIARTVMQRAAKALQFKEST
jgi:phosphopantothenoylcysteine decarboxylase / phosphopantothenate---cysteine ligase